jgi:hypothetical protein
MENQQPSFKKRKSCINARKYHIVKGQQYGPYITLEEVIKVNKKSIERLWKSRHIITDKIVTSRPSYLIKVDNKYKEKLILNNYQNGLKSHLYVQTKTNSKNRNHNFDLTIEEFVNIISKNCFYCGDSPKKVTKKMLVTRGHINEPPIYYNGIDRMDSNLGYTTNNIVPCCSQCNYMKHTTGIDDFYKQIEKIYNYSLLKKGSTTIAKASTSQVYGDGNGEPLTGKAEGEDIVSSV